MLRRTGFALKQFANSQHWHRISKNHILCTSYPISSSGNKRSRIQSTKNTTILLGDNITGVKNNFPRCLFTESADVENDDKHDDVNLTTITKRGRYLELRHNGDEFTIPDIWLRDHCRCHHCFNKDTKQKNLNHHLMSMTEFSKIELQGRGKILKIHWSDGHQSEYEVRWLADNAYSTNPKRKTPPLLWDGAKIQSEPLPTLDYDSYMGSANGTRETLYNLLKYGFSFVKGVPASLHHTEEVVRRLAIVQETLFGKMWIMRFNRERQDTAYTNVELGAHNDTCYFANPIGIVTFHCLSHDGQGGETLLVDGFQVAQKLRQEDPAAFDNLTKQIVPHEYVEEGVHVRSLGHILTVHPASKEMENIRFNPYDMAPLDTIPPNEVEQFYADYHKLAKLMRDPANNFRFKLRPGLLMFVNNWRVLHGRASFTGNRILCGCYFSHDDWMNRARLAGLV